MAEQSHREEMSTAIRAERERHAVPKTIAPDPAEPGTRDDPPPSGRPKRRFARLRGK